MRPMEQKVAIGTVSPVCMYNPTTRTLSRSPMFVEGAQSKNIVFECHLVDKRASCEV